MSTRFYPRFVKGNPQLRIFLPDWKMVMIKTKQDMPDNIVSFRVDPRMTDWDVKNYLEKIYKVDVASVRSRILPGELRRVKVGVGIAKGEDYKIVNVTLLEGQTFIWPNLFPKEKFDEIKKEYESTVKAFSIAKDENTKKNVPSWFA